MTHWTELDLPWPVGALTHQLARPETVGRLLAAGSQEEGVIWAHHRWSPGAWVVAMACVRPLPRPQVYHTLEAVARQSTTLGAWSQEHSADLLWRAWAPLWPDDVPDTCWALKARWNAAPVLTATLWQALCALPWAEQEQQHLAERHTHAGAQWMARLALHPQEADQARAFWGAMGVSEPMWRRVARRHEEGTALGQWCTRVLPALSPLDQFRTLTAVLPGMVDGWRRHGHRVCRLVEAWEQLPEGWGQEPWDERRWAQWASHAPELTAALEARWLAETLTRMPPAARPVPRPRL